MLPITALYAGLLGLLLIGLAFRVSHLRRRMRAGLGDANDTTLQRAIRVHGNATEYVPLGLVLLAVLELNGSATWLLHILGSVLLIGRCLHAWGLNASSGATPPRVIGTAATWLVLLIAAVLNIVGAL
ncbi:MAG: hypothetical protein HKO62_00640 [Gammaproteobacteria bacterium]|nr:MAPEG family protein [Gammaproteobacteria bacterium]NNL99223.1 hypothetical protein [Gammaproteobacteria bacterium]